MVSRLEALFDAISRAGEFVDPASDLYQARNPLGLKPGSMAQARTPDNVRIFKRLVDAYQAGLVDLQRRCSGSPETSLQDLCGVYRLQKAAVGFVAKGLRKALKIEAINEKTPIKFFIEE